MNVFVVLVDAMGGTQFVGVSATRTGATELLDKVTFGTNRRVVEVAVLDEQPDPRIVYTAEHYEPSFDMHFFEAVYGNSDAARRSTGKHDLVIPREI